MKLTLLPQVYSNMDGCGLNYLMIKTGLPNNALPGRNHPTGRSDYALTIGCDEM
jgi:hypothetical protein